MLKWNVGEGILKQLQYSPSRTLGLLADLFGLRLN